MALATGKRAAEGAAFEMHAVRSDSNRGPVRASAGVERRRGIARSAVAQRTRSRSRLNDSVHVKLGRDEPSLLVNHVRMTDEASVRLRMGRWRRQAVT
jgi:hypothetical protein